MSFLRLKNGRIIDDKKISDNDFLVLLASDWIVKQADTVRGLIMKGDLVFAKDGYAGINAKLYPSIACDDIDKCNQYFEKHITKFYIELSNGDYLLAAEEERGELKSR